MRLPRLDLNSRSIRALLWAAGLLALVGGTVGFVLPARPYEAPWAWICFIGMCIVEDYLLGSPADAGLGRLPKVTLLAAIIVFRRHPEITMLVALVSAPVASALKSQRWTAQLSATAQWMLVAVGGATAFRAVGFEDPPHFVAATVALAVVYYALGPGLGAWLESRLTPAPLGLALRHHGRFAIPLEVAGILLALAWRTPALQPAALKLADGALVAVAGIMIGFVFSGRPGWLFRSTGRIPERAAIAGGAILLLGLFTPAPLSWLLPLILALAAGGWAISRQSYAVLSCALGALCNEAVRAVNGGFMPVEGPALMSGLGAANTYIAAGPNTTLAWLDDRFLLPPPFPGIASLGDILIAVGLAWLVATVTARRRGAGAGLSDASQHQLSAAA